MGSRSSWRQSWCIFLDVDGTLLEVAGTPMTSLLAPDSSQFSSASPTQWTAPWRL